MGTRKMAKETLMVWPVDTDFEYNGDVLCKYMSAEQFLCGELHERQERFMWEKDFFSDKGRYKSVERTAKHAFVAVDEDSNDEYLGSVLIHESHVTWILYYIMVIKSQQRQGVGTALIHKVFERARGYGIRWVQTYCHTDQQISFLQHCGFSAFNSKQNEVKT